MYTQRKENGMTCITATHRHNLPISFGHLVSPSRTKYGAVGHFSTIFIGKTEACPMKRQERRSFGRSDPADADDRLLLTNYDRDMTQILFIGYSTLVSLASGRFRKGSLDLDISLTFGRQRGNGTVFGFSWFPYFL